MFFRIWATSVNTAHIWPVPSQLGVLIPGQTQPPTPGRRREAHHLLVDRFLPPQVRHRILCGRVHSFRRAAAGELEGRAGAPPACRLGLQHRAGGSELRLASQVCRHAARHRGARRGGEDGSLRVRQSGRAGGPLHRARTTHRKLNGQVRALSDAGEREAERVSGLEQAT